MTVEEIMPTKAQVSENFAREIEFLVTKKGFNYLDGVLYLCEKNNLEIENIGSIVKSNLKLMTAIKEESEALNFLPKSQSKLPI